MHEVMRYVGSLLQSYVQMRSFIDVEMGRRSSTSADDLLGWLQAAKESGELSDQEAFFYALILLVAGNETTTNLLGMLLVRLAEDREFFLTLKADRSLLRPAVEETARWGGSPVQWVTRTATAPYRIGDTVIPKGAKALLFYASANRDPAKFSDPDRFDSSRHDRAPGIRPWTSLFLSGRSSRTTRSDHSGGPSAGRTRRPGACWTRALGGYQSFTARTCFDSLTRPARKRFLSDCMPPPQCRCLPVPSEYDDSMYRGR